MIKPADHIQNLPPYTPIEPFEVLSARLNRPAEEIIKLDANENPYGPSPLARQALAELPFPNIYPDPESRALRQALAAFTGVPVEALMASAGADELIDLLLRVLLEPGDPVISCPPTFGMYSFDTRLNHGSLVEVMRHPDFALDLPTLRAAILAFQPKIVFLTSPNNPDGSLTSPQDLLSLLDLPALFVVDEAYIEFTDAGGRLGENLSLIRQVPQRQNLVVLRTFSKWAGLAGLRVGYGAFPSGLLPALWTAKQPYNVNVAASAAAVASLRDLDTLAGNVARLRAERQRLYAGLASVPFLAPYPSQSNFILCQVLDRPGKTLKEQLTEKGILVRHYDSPGLSDCVRISAGKPEATDILLAVLKELA
jgi:histidinol-phosphate aminotransferase